MLRKCSVNGCEKAAASRGWCAMHHKRVTRWGSPHIVHMEPDWTEADIAILMAAKLTSHKRRFAGPDPDESFAAVAAKLGRTVSACTCKRRRVEYARGHRTGTQWTKEGLWTAEEDAIVRAHMAPEGERVDVWTWPAVAEAIGRTPAATRVRAYNLRRKRPKKIAALA